MITNDRYQHTFKHWGELLFKTGLPEIFGLTPDDIEPSHENLSTMIGVLKCLGDTGDVNPQDIQRWKIQGTKTVRYL